MYMNSLDQCCCAKATMYTFPELGSSFKAMRVTQLNHFLCRKVVKLADGALADVADNAEAKVRKEIARVRGSMGWAYLSYHKTLDDADLFLTDHEAEMFEQQTHLFNTCLSRLQALDRKHIWKARPKHHGLDHLAIKLIHVSKLNPKKTSCLSEEDFLGHMKNIGRSCMGGNCLSMMGRILDRYLLELALRWHKRSGGDHWLGL